MYLFIEQKILSFRDRFSVKDELGNDKYFVEGEFMSLGNKLHVYDRNNVELALIQQKLMTLLPKFSVFIGSRQVAEIQKKFTLFHPRYIIEGLNWSVEGDLWDHDYSIVSNGREIITIHKKWMSWGDCYELFIEDGVEELVAVAMVLAIDCVMDASNNS
ncbi:Uncharacterized protein YxjI [Hathewaya proteolytica DSM 3090]|uniref:Uncharacterized protein YxjI n=1 Tax=Hathewaya proteolytica DSM 3090 TaxID=1121331 RepID=A0A1M6PKC2_9CLOT|nr:LURP-one-related family protein [Hathewaya proteolytica]SHK08347.1 Uncharacterized protein YxjI [Hathewaya proteolytica DSM 3090]